MNISRVGEADLPDLLPLMRGYCDFYEIAPTDEQLRGMGSMVIPLGRPGTPQEAAGGVFFLCSPWSNFVHGQVLNITGGQFTGMTT